MGYKEKGFLKRIFFFSEYQFHFTWTFENQYRPKPRTWPPVGIVTNTQVVASQLSGRREQGNPKYRAMVLQRWLSG